MGYCEYREELDNRMREDVYEAFVIYLEKIYLKDGADAVRLEYRQYSKEEIDAITWEIGESHDMDLTFSDLSDEFSEAASYLDEIYNITGQQAISLFSWNVIEA
jgi:DNA polymerase II small subunit/DNA polymerase delta subunit B